MVDTQEDLGFRSEFKKPKENKESKLCEKWDVNSSIIALSLENTHQFILNVVKRLGALSNMKKSSQVYFATKIQFEDEWRKGIVRNLWGFYQTHDERMKFWRNLEGQEHKSYLEKISNGQKAYF